MGILLHANEWQMGHRKWLNIQILSYLKLSNTLFIPKYSESFNGGYLSTEHLFWLRSMAVLPDFPGKHYCGKPPGNEE